MGELDRQAVAGMVERDVAPQLDRAAQVAVEPGPDRGDVAALALVGFVGQGFRRQDAVAHGRFEVLVGGHRHDPGLEAMAHDEVGVMGERRIDRHKGIAEKAVGPLQRGLELLQRGLAVRGVADVAPVLQCHCHPPDAHRRADGWEPRPATVASVAIGAATAMNRVTRRGRQAREQAGPGAADHR